jgi:hypothetical protein
MRFPCRYLPVAATLMAALLLFAACGGQEEAAAPSATTEAATPTGAETEEARPSRTAVPPSPTTPAATTTPVPSGTQTSQQAADAAFAAALEQFQAVSEEDCETNNPQKKQCVSAQSSPSEAQRGIAAFGVYDPEGIGGFVGVLGRDPAGEWRLWFETQQAYQLLALPGDMLVCAEGDSLNVRSAPAIDAPVVGSLNDLTAVRAEEFVLTEPASDADEPGYGWYHLSAPLDGWAHSKYLTNALLEDCTLRDAIEAGGSGP